MRIKRKENKNMNKKNDVVNHPSHYTDGKIEVIDFIEDKGLGFCLGNAVKYISRAGKKYPDKEIEDLEKAIWYIKRRIKELKSGEPEKINERLEEMIEKEGLNKDLKPECPEVKKVPLGDSSKNEEEEKIWESLYSLMKAIDSNYTREEFEKDLEKAKEFTKTEIPTLIDFSRILK